MLKPTGLCFGSCCGALLWGNVFGSLSPSSFGPCSAYCSGFPWDPFWVGGASSQCFSFRRHEQDDRYERVYAFCLLLCCVLSTDWGGFAPHNDAASTVTPCRGSASSLPPLIRRGIPPEILSILVFSGSSWPSGAFSFFRLGGWGSPCRVFPFPRRCGSSFLWVGWVPLPRFPRCFPRGSRVGWGSCFVFWCFCFSCYLLRLESFFSCT